MGCKRSIAAAVWGLCMACTLPSSRGAETAAVKCGAVEQRQLDFWVGAWRVFNTADGVEYAGSRIERVLDGCAIRENYDAPEAPGGAYAGSSYSAYDDRDRAWHQMYIDTQGHVTWYSGAMQAEGMVLVAEAAHAKQRMTYRPQADGSVRQIGEVSTDDGKSWQPGYDYTYRKR